MRLGIMGGTFDPVHVGHTQIAGAALKEAGLDRVLFLPDGDPPHKTPFASGLDRLIMIRLAIRGDPAFAVSERELKRPGRTYSVDTLEELGRECPESILHYIIGSDTLYQFPTWKTARRVAQLCRMIVVLRPGSLSEDVREEQRRLHADYGLVSTLLAEDGPDISSSQVRLAIKTGQDIRPFVHPGVLEYIRQNKLYLS